MAEGTRNTGRSKQKTIVVPEMGRLQPQARELEEAVLGALMLEKDAYFIISDILKPECFYEKAHETIYSAIVDLAVSQRPIDMLTVTDQLKKRGDLDAVGGPFYISQLTSKVASSAHIEYHARIIAQKFLARELISFTASIQGQAFDESIDVDDLMQLAEARLFEISQQNVKKDVTQINPVIGEAIELIKKAAEQPEGLSGLRSGFHGLDKMTHGWQNSDLVIIAARPAMGKTAFVLSMAKNMAVQHNTPVALFSLEMSNVQLVNRLIVNITEITADKIKSGRLEKYEWEQLDFKLAGLYDAPIYIDDTPSLSVFELRTKARRLVREHHVRCIIIDYLQLMNASGMNFGSREQEVSMISRSLKGLAKELNIPIIALSQLNRGVESRQGEGKRPQLADLRESGAIEQDADMVCFIHRPEYYKITEDERGNSLIGMAEIIIAKHRNGATGDVRLRFKGEYAKFINVDEDIPVREFASSIGAEADHAQPIPPAGPDFLAQTNNDYPF
ncbi:replicative DNA helicase [Parabacteroides sp. PF5-5]|uniref:replicative DNA helicase n=1 Tax=unclassified Parabacteroides TaxID=2649774 RepID=UPI002475FC19|nr:MULTISPECIES: replicative DNA helicase [unclassified Parabacteroides]MDH6303815.1 replicative DNA helicase [Parabacteroides sp. PH5-39]MDH6314432.1 replicative DNA helicase [Parabacteroides sp. PF5-13]MDH6318503.1 replicative DNA helicase [Parabacteroides sp. PH5-13]MDH6322204.1 replicative DNA helicase [Parabacteroides sp. PH5-8]MDH6325716.1 replicative DNA helicase [Parabacteroides sp. PH5-41]